MQRGRILSSLGVFFFFFFPCIFFWNNRHANVAGRRDPSVPWGPLGQGGGRDHYTSLHKTCATKEINSLLLTMSSKPPSVTFTFTPALSLSYIYTNTNISTVHKQIHKFELLLWLTVSVLVIFHSFFVQTHTLLPVGSLCRPPLLSTLPCTHSEQTPLQEKKEELDVPSLRLSLSTEVCLFCVRFSEPEHLFRLECYIYTIK